ncbi:hypothetical protein C0Z18_09095 [Trinickia dabaoshanensis]|uniref:Lipoprotein n=1 Tax=Trinickia dabaoshanensis TaxID=564714 RepID=A0A2N7VW28_9BURK|nr:hypothetical protein [Trinickia dabaoshanensis]PMS21352.1 hypothetical protein C0Z18_09095 [Trinickia dabaoshanensis]
MRRPASVAAPLVFAVAFAAACTPAYNWRTVTDAAEGYSVDLPAKPTVDERRVEIAGNALPMHVRAAHAQGAVFAVAVVDLPRDDAQLGQAVADALRHSLARNVAASPVEHAVQVPAGSGAAVPGMDVVATGAAGDAHERRTIHAWVTVRGRHVYQAAIIAPEAPPQDQSDQFFGSLRLN